MSDNNYCKYKATCAHYNQEEGCIYQGKSGVYQDHRPGLPNQCLIDWNFMNEIYPPKGMWVRVREGSNGK